MSVLGRIFHDTPEMRETFFSTLAATGSVTQAAEATGIPRRFLYQWKRTKPDFAAEWAAAHELGVQAIEDEAIRRAATGYQRDVWWQGQKVGSTKEYSDTLLVLLLKANMPEKYRDNYNRAADGVVTGGIKITGGLPLGEPPVPKAIEHEGPDPTPIPDPDFNLDNNKY